MAQISSVRKAAIASRIFTQTARRSRIVSAAWAGATATARALTHVAIRLWHEVTGFVFIVFAVIGGSAAYREYHFYKAGAANATPTRIVVALVFALVFLWFGVSSFWRARKVKR